MFSRMRASRVIVVAAGLALATVAVFGGVAMAAGGAAPIAQAAANIAGGKDRLADVLAKLVQQGVITQTQADKVEAALRDAVRTGFEVKRDLAADAAQAIGIPVADLRKELPGKSLAQVAQAHGVSRDALVQKLVAAETARIDKALADKKITQQQADTLKQKLPNAIANGVDRVFPAAKPRAATPFEIAATFQTAAAKAIGITADQLRAELAGKSIAQVAQAHGVSRDAVVAALTNDANARIDAAAAAGKITADQAGKLKAAVPGAVARFVDHTHASR